MLADDLADQPHTDRQLIEWPEGCLAWDQLSQTLLCGPWPRRFGFWPYSAAQFDAICAALKVSVSETFMVKIVACARDYVRLIKLVAENAVGNPLLEVEHLQRALVEVRRSIDGLGLGARLHLATEKAASGPSPFMNRWTAAQREAWEAREAARLEAANASIIESLSRTASAAEAALRQCQAGLKHKPASSKGGQTGFIVEKQIYAHIRSAWHAAYNGKTPKHGWPDFRDACLNPLGISRQDEKAWDALKPNTRRTTQK